MTRRLTTVAIFLVAFVAAWAIETGQSTTVQAQTYTHRTYPDLFYNYYAPPGYPGAAGAELYVSPRPVPAWVGHTYITYQPLMPHEFLYQHHRNYWRQNSNGKWTRVSITWQ